MTRTKLAICLAVMLIAAVTQLGCSDNGTSSDGYFEIHEWGILAGYDGDSTYFLTGRPEGGDPMVDVPVIYVHSDVFEPFDASVTFSDGEPLITYPTATITGQTARWDDVYRVDPNITRKVSYPDDSLTLDEIIPILDDVDANLLNYNDVLTRFLFYEGTLPFANLIEVTYDLDSMTARFQSNASYPVFNLILAIDPEGIPGIGPSFFALLDQMDPGAVEVASIAMLPSMGMIDDLVDLGFTRREAEAFNTLWAGPILIPGHYGHTANLCYRLPQTQFDQLISLSIDPEPTGVLRALYILVHLDPPVLGFP